MSEIKAPFYLCPCGYSFELFLGKYGCPNCCGDDGPAVMVFPVSR